MKKVYLAGPITGLEFDAAKDWRDDDSRLCVALRSHGWEPLSPMRNKEHFRVEGKLSAFFDEGAAAVEQDLHDIESASAVIANFTGATKTSLGSSAEIGYAYALGRPIIVITEGNPDEWEKTPHPTNPHHHVFVRYMATEIVNNLDDAIEMLHQIHRREAIENVPYAPPIRPLGGAAWELAYP